MAKKTITKKNTKKIDKEDKDYLIKEDSSELSDDDSCVEENSILSNKKSKKKKAVKKVVALTTEVSNKGTRKSNRVPIDEAKIYDIDKILDSVHNQSNKVGEGFACMLANNYDGSQEIDGWLMSEKLDGVRCIWDGSKMYSRANNRFFPPEFFTKDMPKDIVLDGELFLDRGKFRDTISIVKKKTPHDGWKQIKYVVFDAPNVKGTFTERLKAIEKSLKDNKSPYIKLHEQENCVNSKALDKRMDEVIALKGEGMIVRDPNSLYENRRAKTMLKVKRFLDAEATVIAHIKGTGRISNIMGAIQVRTDDGVEFKIGSGFDDSERRKPPKIGSRVTYRYFEISKDSKKPRFPTFMRVHPGM